jgi:hypothetical protein
MAKRNYGLIRAKLFFQLFSSKTLKNLENKKSLCSELIFKHTASFI